MSSSPVVRHLYRQFSRVFPQLLSYRAVSSLEEAATEIRQLTKSTGFSAYLKQRLDALKRESDESGRALSPEEVQRASVWLLRETFRVASAFPAPGEDGENRLESAFQVYRKLLSRYSIATSVFSTLSNRSSFLSDSHVLVTASSRIFREFPAKGFFFQYSIKIENKNTEKIVQLMKRKWIITDSASQTMEVEGEGVIGKKPILKPGESFQYESGTPLPTPVGKMEGEFSFRVLEESKDSQAASSLSFFSDPGQSLVPTGEFFTAQVAPFLLAREKMEGKK